MRLPKKLKIGGHVFTVDASKELDNSNGETDYKKNLISICKTITKDQQESTLIHEIFHCVNTTFCDKDTSHILLDSLAEQLYQVLSDNKLLR